MPDLKKVNIYDPASDKGATVSPNGDLVVTLDGETVGISGNISSISVVNAIESNAFDLNAATYSVATAITTDYILDSIEFNFSTAESKTITVTSASGTKIYEDTNTNQNISLIDINTAFDANDNITVAVTQFSSAGTMDCWVKARTVDAIVGSSIDATIAGFDSSLDTTPLPVDDIKKPLTAFGELLVGQLYPQFQGSFEYTVDNTDLNTNTVTNGGTVTQATGMAVIGSSTTTNSTALFQSKRHAKYRPGLGGNQRFTALFETSVASTEQYFGVMDETGSSAAFKNGYAIGFDGTTFGVHRFQNDAKTTVALASCDDPLDGTGASGMTYDSTKVNVFEIRFQYLGVGAIQYCIEDDSTGRFVVFHTVLYANNNTVPSVYNPNFFFTVWVNNKATTTDLVIKCASYAFFVEGKTSFIELHQPENSSGLKEKTAVTTEVAIFTIRNKTSYASKTNFIDILLLGAGASIEASQANNLGSVRIVKNTTLGGTPSWSDINTSNSVVEIDTAGTTVTGGKDLGGELLAGKNDKALIALIDFKIILNPGETLTFAGLSANSSTIDARTSWRELF